jgi:hypothetical protein
MSQRQIKKLSMGAGDSKREDGCEQKSAGPSADRPVHMGLRALSDG